MPALPSEAFNGAGREIPPSSSASGSLERREVLRGALSSVGSAPTAAVAQSVVGGDRLVTDIAALEPRGQTLGAGPRMPQHTLAHECGPSPLVRCRQRLSCALVVAVPLHGHGMGGQWGEGDSRGDTSRARCVVLTRER